jgi:cytidylate kinase
MAAKTITITTRLGSGGFTIARSIADELGFRYYDWEVTSQAAQEAGVSEEAVAQAERVPSLAERIMERFFNAGFYAGDIPEAVVPTSTTMDTAIQTLTSSNYRDLIAHVVQDLARRGDCVIVGHAAQLALQDQSDVLKVLVHGSELHRATRLAVDEGMPGERALSTIQRSDRDRATFFRHYYKVNWLDPVLYDITVNTDRISDAQAASLIVLAAKDAVAAGA